MTLAAADTSRATLAVADDSTLALAAALHRLGLDSYSSQGARNVVGASSGLRLAADSNGEIIPNIVKESLRKNTNSVLKHTSNDVEANLDDKENIAYLTAFDALKSMNLAPKDTVGSLEKEHESYVAADRRDGRAGVSRPLRMTWSDRWRNAKMQKSSTVKHDSAAVLRSTSGGAAKRPSWSGPMDRVPPRRWVDGKRGGE